MMHFAFPLPEKYVYFSSGGCIIYLHIPSIYPVNVHDDKKKEFEFVTVGFCFGRIA